MKKLLWVHIFLLFHAQLCSQTPNKSILSSLTLPDAVTQAFKHKPNIKGSLSQVDAARIGERIAWVDYFPKVSLTSQPTFFASGEPGCPSSTITALSLQQLIFSFAGPQEKAKIATIQRESAELQLELAHHELRMATEQLFFEAWKVQEQHASIEGLLASSVEQEKQNAHEFKLSLKNKSNWYKGEAEHAVNYTQSLAYQDRLKSLEAQMNYLLGYALPIKFSGVDATTLSWDQPKKIVLKSLDHYVQEALNHRPEIRIHKKTVNLYEQKAKIASLSRLPTVSFGGSVTHTSFEHRRRSNQHYQDNQHSLGAIFSWPLFDGLSSDYEREKFNALKLQALFQLEEAQNLVRSQVEVAFAELKKCLHELTAESFNYLRAKNDYEVKNIEFQCELLSQPKHIQACSSWANAKFNWLEKKAAVASHLHKLYYRCGYPEKMSYTV